VNRVPARLSGERAHMRPSESEIFAAANPCGCGVCGLVTAVIRQLLLVNLFSGCVAG
jgi:hypothetical protein